MMSDMKETSKNILHSVHPIMEESREWRKGLRGALYSTAKSIVNLIENKDFKAPTETKFNLPGKIVKDEMFKILEKLYDDKIILDHGMVVGKELANVLSGGDTTIDKTLSEDDLFKLELDAFMKLIETQKTQDRIKHTLATGKPLVN